MPHSSNKVKPALVRAYMDVALRFAQESHSKRLKVGAVIVKNDSILSHGWNGTPSGYHTNECELPDGSTSPYVLHAEENALVKLCKSTESMEGADIFCTHSPCVPCARRLAQGKIRTVYYAYEYRDAEGLRALVDLGVDVVKVPLNELENRND
jgi:dCMP deaminase